MSGGGDTPSPTLKRFCIAKGGASKYRLTTEEGERICFYSDDDCIKGLSSSADGTGWTFAASTNPEAVVAEGIFDEEVKVVISLEGYETLEFLYDDGGDDTYNAVTYIPEALD